MKAVRFGLAGWVLALALSGCAAAPRGATLAPSASPEATTATTHGNIIATRKFSKWMLHAVPMPPSAREWSHSPTRQYRQAWILIGPSDRALTRTTWWTVPVSPTALGSWLRAHTPHALTAEAGEETEEAGGVLGHALTFHAPSNDIHTQGSVNFDFMPHDHGLAVRVDTFVGARFARTVQVPTDTTTVRIRRTERPLTSQTRPIATVHTITDTAAVDDLVRMINDLPGAMTKPVAASCPAAKEQQSYRMTFATPHGSYAAVLPTTTCWPRLTLTRNGAKVGPALDPGQTFVKLAEHYLK